MRILSARTPEQISADRDPGEDGAPVHRTLAFAFSQYLRDDERGYRADDDELPAPAHRSGQESARFMALLKESVDRARRDQYANDLTQNRLCWRFVNGRLAGCEIRARWDRRALRLEIAAGGEAAERLLRLRGALTRRLARAFPHLFISVEVIRGPDIP
ncbi:hypothetical protein QNH14_12605 [Apirhabdus apintestini]|nr:hypothetical protein QNH14_12605 [Enterobacteriaceae bacterium CA-0114]